MTNQPNQVAEVLCEVIYDCFRKGCPKFAKQGCGDCDVIEKALTKLGGIIKECLPEDRPCNLEGAPLKSYINETIFINKLSKAGFLFGEKNG